MSVNIDQITIETVKEIAEKVSSIELYKKYAVLSKTDVDFSFERFDLADGFAGVCLLLGELDKRYPDEGWDLKGHQLLIEIQNSLINEEIPNYSLWIGLTGIAMSVKWLSRNGTRYKQLSNQLNDMLIQELPQLVKFNREHLGKELKVTDYDIVCGLSGIARYLLYFKDTIEFRRILSEIIDYLILLSCTRITKNGVTVPNCFIEREKLLSEIEQNKYPNGYINLSCSHGISGILSILSIALLNGIERPNQKEAIHWYANLLIEWKQSDQNGKPIWNSLIGLDELLGKKVGEYVHREAWCYGSPGICRSLWLAGTALHVTEWKSLAMEGIKATFGRSMNTWNIDAPTLCHGYAGLLQILNRFHLETNNEQLMKHKKELTNKILEMLECDKEYRLDVWLSEENLLNHRYINGVIDGASGTALALLGTTGSENLDWDAMFLLS